MRKVSTITPLDNYRLLVEFNNGDQRLYDMSDELTEVFGYLKNTDVFNSVRLVFGVPTWSRPAGLDIDVCPDYIHMNSTPYEGECS